jgi:hypothetical protein
LNFRHRHALAQNPKRKPPFDGVVRHVDRHRREHDPKANDKRRDEDARKSNGVPERQERQKTEHEQ